MARATEQACQVIREGIGSGAYPAGKWLREEEIAAVAGVSRTPVREALRRLQAEGLVEVLPNRGAMVVRWGEADLDDIFDLRALLEGYAVRQAAERHPRSACDLESLMSLCAVMDQRLDRLGEDEKAYEEITELNLQFHTALHEWSGNRRLLTVLPNIIRPPLVWHTFHRYTHEELTRSFAHHRELLDAIAAGDGDWAESIMHAHLRAARASLRRAAAKQADGPVEQTGDATP